MLSLTAKTGNPFNHLAGKPNLQFFGVEPNVHPLADQTAVNRIDVSVHTNDAAGTDPDLRSLVAL